MDKRKTVIVNLCILRTWCAVNPDYGRGLNVEECEKAVGWLDDAIGLMNAEEAVYPTWWDWLAAGGLDPDDPIPAEIAQMLGIEPVPVVHGDCGATNEADARKKLGIEPKEVER